jgi:hypothetical protein
MLPLHLLKKFWPTRYVRLYVASTLDGLLAADTDRVKLIKQAFRNLAVGGEKIPEQLFQTFGLFLRRTRQSPQAAARIASGNFADGYAMVLAMLQRQFRWCLVDLFRGRIAACHTHLRQQAESVGLVALFLEDSTICERWFRLRHSSEGIRFFRESNKPLMKKLRDLGLVEIYDRGSHEGVHVRSIQLLRSYHFPAEEATGGQRRTLLVTDADLDLPDLRRFCRDASIILAAQVKVLDALGRLFPDSSNDDLNEAITSLRQNVERFTEAATRQDTL